MDEQKKNKTNKQKNQVMFMGKKNTRTGKSRSLTRPRAGPDASTRRTRPLVSVGLARQGADI